MPAADLPPVLSVEGKDILQNITDHVRKFCLFSDLANIDHVNRRTKKNRSVCISSISFLGVRFFSFAFFVYISIFFSVFKVLRHGRIFQLTSSFPCFGPLRASPCTVYCLFKYQTNFKC